MKTRWLAPQPRRSPKAILVFIALTLLLVSGLFLASVVLTPLAARVQALNAPPAATFQAPTDNGVNGTLASFTALFPIPVTVSLPLIIH